MNRPRALLVGWTTVAVLAAQTGFPVVAEADVGPAVSGRVTPAHARIYIPRGATRPHRVFVATDAITTMKPLDVLLLVDCSGSMDAQLGAMRARAGDVVARVQQNHPAARFAVASFSDHFPSHSGDPRDYPFRLHQTFTAEGGRVVAALGEISILHGGDGPESYSFALHEATHLPWNESARKVIVVFGDSVAHAVDPGRDGIAGTADDLRPDDAPNELAARGITVLGVYEPKAPAVRSYFEMLAFTTGGQAIALREGRDAPAAVLAGLARTLRIPSRIDVPAEYKEWIDRVDRETTSDADPSVFLLTLRPNNPSADVHRVHVVAVVDADNAAPIGTSEIEIVTGWINDPRTHRLIAFSLGLLPLALLLLWLLRRARRSVIDAYYFNAFQRWARAARSAVVSIVIVAYLCGIAWAYAKLQDPRTPPVSELLARFPYVGRVL